jgi:hypothetical protein
VATAFYNDKAFANTSPDDPGEDMAEFILTQSLGTEARDSSIIRHFRVDRQLQEIFVGQVQPGILDYSPV